MQGSKVERERERRVMGWERRIDEEVERKGETRRYGRRIGREGHRGS